MNEQDKMREARIRAFDDDISNNDSSIHTSHISAVDRPLVKKERVCSPITLIGTGNMESIIKTAIGTSFEPDDMKRWFSQGFQFADSPNFGLMQGHGGPCGILAAMQAEIMKDLLFCSDNNITDANIMSVDPNAIKHSFVTAAWNILHRCKTDDAVYMVDPANESIFDIPSCSKLVVHECYSEVMFHELFNKLMPQYRSECGCFLFLLSLILTRGASVIRDDMDDSETSLIGQYGHCTQELINLLLIGRASTYVFDGDLPFQGSTSSDGESLVLKGVPHRPQVGYLSHLEALRYCQVGSYYKTPEFPVWVIGSSSHFSVLFSLDKRLNEESREEEILARVQRAFKAVDIDGCGFIMEQRLGEILSSLEIPLANDKDAVARLSSFLQLDGGIIIWSTFWENISQLMTGTTLDELLSPKNSNHSRHRSDSDVAREIQAGFNSLAEATPNSASPGRPRSDSEIARQMQEEWNSDIVADLSNQSETSPNPAMRSTRHRSDSVAGKDDESFVLYHYNGFQGVGNTKSLCKFILYRRSAVNSIGQAIGFTAEESLVASNICPMEEVLRTRWQGCSLNFLGQSFPSLE
eukprot:CAMPEP_0185036198 /NCGR_PEP_ID=MMETSP1103-20130426/28780_1 /TAXON_ID=36769 /ORGANISM="Paraphysomonas bandaiensis, Strain Caron Lab Isolate" /LENGTH=580 /DNA_ID=CAMNT_0027573637 /DNA_START=29 /DNA_END=1771 /DNA_ORIENTATION=-